jgi:superfamily II DNA or RNA helicase
LGSLESAVATRDRAGAEYRSSGAAERPSLHRFEQELRPYQSDALRRAWGAASRTPRRLLLSLPTGTGKGSVQLELLSLLRAQNKAAWIVTPSIDVMRGYLERTAATPEQLSGNANALAKLGAKIGVSTPMRLRNQLKAGKVAPPDFVIMDEAHHAVEDNLAGGGLAEVAPGACWIGFTATPFRHMDAEKDLNAFWGKPEVVLSIPQAHEIGAWAKPKVVTVPIVDDDKCKVERGELVSTRVVTDAAKMIAKLVKTRLSADTERVPTAVTVGGIEVAEEMAAKLRALAVESDVLLGDTPTDKRAVMYARCREGKSVLISVRVLGEGVDLPWLRRIVDARPTTSPVLFLQHLGRITRPGPGTPEYICTNRNIERHAYLLEGLLNGLSLAAAEAFKGPSKRGRQEDRNVKAWESPEWLTVSLPRAGRVAPYVLRMRFFQHAGAHRLELVVLERPDEMPRFGLRRLAVTPDGTPTGQRWELFDTYDEMTSGLTQLADGVRHKGLVFQKCLMSHMLDNATEGEQAFWKEQAPLFQLDPDAKIIRAQVYAPLILRAFRKEPATYTEVTPGTWGAVVETVARPVPGQQLLVSWPDAADTPALPTNDDRAADGEDRDKRSRIAAARAVELRAVDEVHSGEAGKWTVLLSPKVQPGARTHASHQALALFRDLNPQQHGPLFPKLKFEARVVGISPLKKMRDGLSHWFFATLEDKEGGKIQAYFWRDAATKFHPLIKPDTTYTFAGAAPSPINRNYDFGETDSKYQLTIEADAQISDGRASGGASTSSAAGSSTGSAQVNSGSMRKRILDVTLVPEGTVVNLMGIAVEVDEQLNLTRSTRNKGSMAHTLGVLLADKSGASIRVTLWGNQAINLLKYTKTGSPRNTNPVLEITAVVRTFGGRSASARSTTVQSNSPEARELVEWFKAGGASDAKPLTLTPQRGR